MAQFIKKSAFPAREIRLIVLKAADITALLKKFIPDKNPNNK
jgi:hypothetical protein